MRWLLALLVIALAGCGDGVRPLAAGTGGGPSAGAELIAMGHTGSWLGGGLLAFGLVARALGGSIGWLIAEAGAVLLALGLAATWAGGHLAILAALGLAVVGLWGWCRRRSLGRWLGLRASIVAARPLTPQA